MNEHDRDLATIAAYMRERGDSPVPSGLLTGVRDRAMRPEPLRTRLAGSRSAFWMQGTAAIGGLAAVVVVIVLVAVVAGLPLSVAQGPAADVSPSDSGSATPSLAPASSPTPAEATPTLDPGEDARFVDVVDTPELHALASAERAEPLVVVARARIEEGTPRRGPACPPISLRGTPCHLGAIVGLDEPVISVSADLIATSEDTNGTDHGTEWPWWTLPALPIEGLVVLSITAPYEVEYLGRLQGARVGDGVSDVLLSSLALDEVVLVDGWLGGFGTIPFTCAPPSDEDEPMPGLPSRRCMGGASWITQEHPDRRGSGSAPEVPDEAIRLQANAYEQYADDPEHVEAGSDLAQGQAVPRRGVYVLAGRLQGDGCESEPAPCAAWEVVGRIDAPVEPAPAPTPTPPPDPSPLLSSPEPTEDWELESGSLDGASIPIVDGHPITLLIGDSAVWGMSACNSYGAELTSGNGSFRFGESWSTAAGCPDDVAVAASEAAYFAALHRVETSRRESGELVLSGNGVELRFRPLPPPATPSPAPSVFEGSLPETYDHVITLLLERTSRDMCIVTVEIEYDEVSLRQQAQELAEEVGPGPRRLSPDLYLGTLDEAIDGFRGTESLAVTGGYHWVWYLARPQDAEPWADDPLPEMVAAALLRVELPDGREVWWRNGAYVAVTPCG